MFRKFSNFREFFDQKFCDFVNDFLYSRKWDVFDAVYKKNTKKFAKIFIEKILQSLSIFRKIEKSGNFRKIENRTKFHFNWKFSKIENVRPKMFEIFEEILENFDFFRKKTNFGYFFDQKFWDFFWWFFLNHIRNIWFPRIVGQFSTIPRCVSLRSQRVRPCFAFFFKLTWPKGLFFLE